MKVFAGQSADLANACDARKAEIAAAHAASATQARPDHFCDAQNQEGFGAETFAGAQ